jgi:hypothetical protein
MDKCSRKIKYVRFTWRRENWINCNSSLILKYLKAFSSMEGIILPKRGHDNSRHGFVFA